MLNSRKSIFLINKLLRAGTCFPWTIVNYRACADFHNSGWNTEQDVNSAYRASLKEESPGANGRDDRPRARPPSLKGWDTGEISTPPIKNAAAAAAIHHAIVVWVLRFCRVILVEGVNGSMLKCSVSCPVDAEVFYYTFALLKPSHQMDDENVLAGRKN